MRAQLKDILDMAVDATFKMRFPNIIFVLGLVTLALYIFIYTQGVSPTERLGEKGEEAAQILCKQVETITGVNALPYIYTDFCKSYVCGTLNKGTLNEETGLVDIDMGGIKCGTADEEGIYPDRVAYFNTLASKCSQYCLKGMFDVKSVARQAEGYINFAFGKTAKYCVFLKTGAMMSSVIPRCTDKDVLANDRRLCVRGFKCYLYGSKETCECDSIMSIRGNSSDEIYYSDDDDRTDYSCEDYNNNEVFGFTVTSEKLEDYKKFVDEVAFPAQTTDLAWGNFVSQKFPTPICVIFFGLLPFGVTYFLLLDIMYFIPLTDDAKTALAVLVSMFSIIMGTYSNIVLMIMKLSRWSLSTSFLFCLFSAGIVGAILKSVIQSLAVKQKVNKELLEFAGGLGELAK